MNFFGITQDNRTQSNGPSRNIREQQQLIAKYEGLDSTAQQFVQVVSVAQPISTKEALQLAKKAGVVHEMERC